jgi:hypothetical protein
MIHFNLNYFYYSFAKLSKSALVNNLFVLGAIGMLASSFAFSIASNYVSYWNYPGGDAIKFFNRDYGKRHL